MMNSYFMSDRDHLLAEYYKGLERTDEEDSAYARRQCLNWTTIAASVKILPQFEDETNKLVEYLVGYYIPVNNYMSYAPLLRGFVSEHHSGKITYEELTEKMTPIVKLIRNDDMEINGWAMTHNFMQSEFDYYKTNMAAYKTPARERLTAYLGYPPDIEHSLYAEMAIRCFLQYDWFHAEIPFISWDFQAVTIYNYRKQIMLYGLEAARQSLLVNGA